MKPAQETAHALMRSRCGGAAYGASNYADQEHSVICCQVARAIEDGWCEGAEAMREAASKLFADDPMAVEYLRAISVVPR